MVASTQVAVGAVWHTWNPAVWSPVVVTDVNQVTVHSPRSWWGSGWAGT